MAKWIVMAGQKRVPCARHPAIRGFFSPGGVQDVDGRDISREDALRAFARP
jgi:hypothetical protein